jgi:hypothetical protein
LSRDGRRLALQELIPSEFQLAKMEANATTKLFTINLPSTKENEILKKKIDQTNHYMPLLKNVESIKFVDQNVGFAKPNGGQKLRQLARKQT